MNVNFKKPKYILPLILLPFLFLLNYSLQPFYKEEESAVTEGKEEIQDRMGDVSEQIRNKGLEGKLDAFRSRYKNADGYTAIKNLRIDVEEQEGIMSQYNDAEKRMLDSIDQVLRKSMNQTNPNHKQNTGFQNFQSEIQNRNITKEDEDLLRAIEQLQGNPKNSISRYDDPMELFKAQMAVIDSISKANDPSAPPLTTDQPEQKSPQRIIKQKVAKADQSEEYFNTVSASQDLSFIKAIVDENLEKGMLGGRLRIRILEDITIGNSFLAKGTYLYALISGYDAQRIKLQIKSVLVDDKIHPIQLSIYDMDGFEGLYVPINSFRQLTKDLGGNASSGVNLQMQQNPGSINQIYMSALQRVFSSTSQAMSKKIRQNQVNVKYGTFIYLIDTDELQKNQLSDLDNP